MVEVADLDDPAGRDLFARLGETPGLPPLSRRVATADRAALAELMDDAGTDDDDFAATESWAAALMLAAAVRESDPANGVDRALIADARRVEGLESFAGQLAMFDGLSARAQQAMLAGVAREHGADISDDVLRAWLAGDEAGIAAQVDGPLLADPDLRRVLLTQRNAAWTGRIAALIAAGERPFVAVGAGHVVGADGLAARLAARGLAVRRIQ